MFRSIQPGFIALTAVFGILWSGSAAAVCHSLNDFAPGGVTAYEGASVAGNPVRIAIREAAGHITGQYAFADSDTALPLSGELKDNRLTLSLQDQQDREVAKIDGKFLEHDPKHFNSEPLTCDSLEAQWTESNGKTTALALVLASWTATESAPLVDQAAYKFRKATLEDRQAEVAAALSYPITILTYKGRKRFANPRAFLARYNEIITPEFRDMMRCTIPFLLFSRYDGTMLHDGEVWFNDKGKIFYLAGGKLSTVTPDPHCMPQ